MERIWAPWRMAYIENIDKEENDCIFCTKAAEERDDENFIVCREENCFVLLNAYPYTNGHLLIAPYRHTGDLTSLSAEEAQGLMCAAARVVKALKQAMHPEGFNIGMNLGRPAGAGIADHLHLHIVPRWSGDTNFMSVCSDAKVIPEALSVTLVKIRAALGEPDGG
jgi:ATP adenylyltransferase